MFPPLTIIYQINRLGLLRDARRIAIDQSEDQAERRSFSLGALRPSAPSAVTLEHASSGSRAA
jgi:hypothetical protein